MPTSETYNNYYHAQLWPLELSKSMKDTVKQMEEGLDGDLNQSLLFSGQNTLWKRKACSSPFIQELFSLMQRTWGLGHQSVFCNISAQLRKCGHVSSEIHYYVFPFGKDKTKQNEMILVSWRISTMVHLSSDIFSVISRDITLKTNSSCQYIDRFVKLNCLNEGLSISSTGGAEH